MKPNNKLEEQLPLTPVDSTSSEESTRTPEIPYEGSASVGFVQSEYSRQSRGVVTPSLPLILTSGIWNQLEGDTIAVPVHIVQGFFLFDIEKTLESKFDMKNVTRQTFMQLVGIYAKSAFINADLGRKDVDEFLDGFDDDQLQDLVPTKVRTQFSETEVESFDENGNPQTTVESNPDWKLTAKTWIVDEVVQGFSNAMLRNSAAGAILSNVFDDLLEVDSFRFAVEDITWNTMEEMLSAIQVTYSLMVDNTPLAVVMERLLTTYRDNPLVVLASACYDMSRRVDLPSTHISKRYFINRMLEQVTGEALFDVDTLLDGRVYEMKSSFMDSQADHYSIFYTYLQSISSIQGITDKLTYKKLMSTEEFINYFMLGAGTIPLSFPSSLSNKIFKDGEPDVSTGTDLFVRLLILNLINKASSGASSPVDSKFKNLFDLAVRRKDTDDIKVATRLIRIFSYCYDAYCETAKMFKTILESNTPFDPFSAAKSKVVLKKLISYVEAPFMNFTYPADHPAHLRDAHFIVGSIGSAPSALIDFNSKQPGVIIKDSSINRETTVYFVDIDKKDMSSYFKNKIINGGLFDAPVDTLLAIVHKAAELDYMFYHPIQTPEFIQEFSWTANARRIFSVTRVKETGLFDALKTMGTIDYISSASEMSTKFQIPMAHAVKMYETSNVVFEFKSDSSPIMLYDPEAYPVYEVQPTIESQEFWQAPFISRYPFFVRKMTPTFITGPWSRYSKHYDAYLKDFPIKGNREDQRIKPDVSSSERLSSNVNLDDQSV